MAFLTTAIAYTNGPPHIGHAYELVLSDAIARFWQQTGRNVLFSTGTDEHGQKIAQTAAKAGLSPEHTKMFVDSHALRFIELNLALRTTPNVLVRTTSDSHKKAVVAMWRTLLSAGYIYQGEYQGWYSVQDESYYADSEVVNGVALPTESPVEQRTEKNHFFRLSAFQEPLLEWYRANPNLVYPASRLNEMIRFVESGLQDISVSRDSVSWGIPVPDQDGSKTIYVWLDALVNYLTAAGYPDPKWGAHWPPDLQVVGKDILRFHAVYWPAFLMAAGLPLPRQILAHGWILAPSGIKMGKSLGNAVDPFGLVEEFGIDAVRYTMLRDVSVGHDGELSRETVIRRLNGDLANDLGNLVQRVAILMFRIQNQVEDWADLPGVPDSLWELQEAAWDNARPLMETYQFPQAIEEIFRLVRATNAFVQEMAPWKVAKEKGPVEALKILWSAAEAIRTAAILLAPVIPNGAKTILDTLGVPGDLQAYRNITKPCPRFIVQHKPQPIFQKIQA